MRIGHTHSAMRAPGRALTLRCVEKSGGCNSLHEKHERRSGRTLKYSGRDRRAGASRIDTGYSRSPARNGMPAGFVALPEFDRSSWIAGATYKPNPDVAIKFDYVFNRNASSVVRALNGINMGIGWWF